MDENKIIPYIEPIFRFCYKRLSNRYDAEDLASEIICHILEGMNKYQIESLDAWVWRIAHLTKKIAHIIQQALGLSAKVKIVEPQTLVRSQGKAVHVIDNRKLY